MFNRVTSAATAEIFHGFRRKCQSQLLVASNICIFLAQSEQVGDAADG
jgi:hypothetical protein